MLTPKQENFLNVWLTNPLLTNRMLCEKAGVSENQFYKWKRQYPEFMEEYRRRCRQKFEGLEAKALEVLEGQIMENNFQAVKYVLDGLGYKPTDKVEVQQTTINVTVDDE